MRSCAERSSQWLEVRNAFLLFYPPYIADNDEALRALQNPALFTSKHYKQAAIAVGVGIAIRLAIAVPVITSFSRSHAYTNTVRLLASRSYFGSSPS